jgi:hypothetical protein
LFERSKTAGAELAASDLGRAAELDSHGGLYDYFAALRLDRAPPAANPMGRDRPDADSSATLHFERAASVQPFMPIVLAPYGRFLLRGDRPCESIDALETAVSLDFYFTMAHYDLANAYRLCGHSRKSKAEGAIAILTQPALSFATAWREGDAAFLRECLAIASTWAFRWEVAMESPDNEFHATLLRFLEKRSSELSGEEAIVAAFTLSDTVGADLPGDPFAFLFQRRSPYFALTEIPLSAPASGSWAPNGIGAIRQLRALSFEEVREAYRGEQLERLMASLGEFD